MFEGLKKALRRGLLLDSSLLFLYLFGCYDFSSIPRLRDPKDYTENDFLLLHSLVKETMTLYCLPNVLTEFGNYATKLHGYKRKEFLDHVKNDLTDMIEHYIPMAEIVGWDKFSQFGVTDSAIAMFARTHECLVVVKDGKLYGMLSNMGIQAIDFKVFRSLS